MVNVSEVYLAIVLVLGVLAALLTIWVLALHHRPQSVPMSRPMEVFVRKVLVPFWGWTCCKNVCLLVGCLTSQQHASVSQGRICTDNFTCCHTEIEVADPTFYLTQSQYTDTGPTSPSADPITPGAWQGSHWSLV